MTVDNSSVIDIVAHDPASDVVLLVLVEPRFWGDDGTLLPELQAKLDKYLAYVSSGQFAAEYPAYQGKPIRFDLRIVYPLGPRELEFLDIVRRTQLAPRGIELSWKQHDWRVCAGGYP